MCDHFVDNLLNYLLNANKINNIIISFFSFGLWIGFMGPGFRTNTAYVESVTANLTYNNYNKHIETHLLPQFFNAIQSNLFTE